MKTDSLKDLSLAYHLSKAAILDLKAETLKIRIISNLLHWKKSNCDVSTCNTAY